MNGKIPIFTVTVRNLQRSNLVKLKVENRPFTYLYIRRTRSTSRLLLLYFIFIFIYYILTRFIDKFNAFLHFYRKNQCVSLFETKTKVFSKNHLSSPAYVLPITSLDWFVVIFAKTLDFQPTFLVILPNFPYRIFVLS